MRTLQIAAGIAGLCLVLGCGSEEAAAPEEASPGGEVQHASNIPPLDENNIVRLVSDSEEHTTLVAAIQAADYVTSVAASGPLTVFAPTNAAFEALPDGTVEELLKPENADQLRELLKYHVTTSALEPASFRDGQQLGMANGAKATIGVEDGRLSINGAAVTASIRASNGMIHVVDAVLLPPDA